MTFSLLQLNINADNFWDDLINYLTSYDFDIIQLQEVCGKDTINGIINSKRDNFAELQKVLANKYHGEIAITDRFTSSPSSYIGNAIFYKNDFSLVSKNAVTLHTHEGLFPSDSWEFKDEGRALLHLTLAKENKSLSFLTTHGAWAPDSSERPYQTEQGKILFAYLKKITPPFVFSGDMNLSPDQPTIKNIGTLARNLGTEKGITNSLNPRLHRAKQLFPPGLVVDYIFATPDLTVKNFQVVEEDISDHLGLRAEFEI